MTQQQTYESLAKQAQLVVAARHGHQVVKDAVKTHEERIRADYQYLYDELADAFNCQTAEEARLRELTLAAYAETGDKTPGPGVGIRVEMELVYYEDQAFLWAKEHGLGLKLDKGKFEALAKVDTPPFVSKKESIKATIATDLANALES